MTNKDSLALAAATKQKRLRYWKERFLAEHAETGVTPESNARAQEIGSRLQTYGLLITKLATASNDEARADAESRLAAIERELTTLFEARRLMTTELGVPRISGAGED